MLIKNEDWASKGNLRDRREEETGRKKEGRRKEEREEGREERGKEERLKEPGFRCLEKIKLTGHFIPGRCLLQPVALCEAIFTSNG